MRTESLFIELLQLAVGTRDELSRVPTSLEWQTLLKEAKRQTILGVLLDGIERLPADQKPPELLMLEWFGLVRRVEYVNEVRLQRTKELATMFSSAGFENCVLKGMAMARYYPHPERRQCGDIDLWTFGSRKEVMAWIRSQWMVGHQTWHNVGTKIFDDVQVEVHFHPGWLWNPWHNRMLQKFFDRYKDGLRLENGQKSEQISGVNVMPVEFDTVYSLVHTYRHFIAEGGGLRHVVDYYYILKEANVKGLEARGERREMRGVFGDIKKVGMAKFCAAMMWVMKEVMGVSNEMLLCEPNEKEGQFLLNELMAAGNFGIKRVGPELKANSWRRYAVMIRHYPVEVVWMIPWKIWHRCWRLSHRRYI